MSISDSLSERDRRALQSLVDWWAQAGVAPLDVPGLQASPRRAPLRDTAQIVTPPPRNQARPADAGQDRQAATKGPAPDRPTRPDAPPARSFTERVRADRAAKGAPAGSPKASRPSAQPAAPNAAPQRTEPAIDSAAAMAAEADSLPALRAALEGFTAHPLHAAARNTVFSRGDPDASIMVVGEAPGREEDERGLPFVGRSGRLLDAMFAAIGLSADSKGDQAGLYITNIVNWRPPGNRNPSADEIALCLPFIARHIALQQPRLLVLAGGVAAQTLLNTRQGIMRLRGRWAEYRLPDAPSGASIPGMPLFHPAFLLRRPIAKRDAWADLQAIRDRLDGHG